LNSPRGDGERRGSAGAGELRGGEAAASSEAKRTFPNLPAPAPAVPPAEEPREGGGEASGETCSADAIWRLPKRASPEGCGCGEGAGESDGGEMESCRDGSSLSAVSSRATAAGSRPNPAGGGGGGEGAASSEAILRLPKREAGGEAGGGEGEGAARSDAIWMLPKRPAEMTPPPPPPPPPPRHATPPLGDAAGEGFCRGKQAVRWPLRAGRRGRRGWRGGGRAAGGLWRLRAVVPGELDFALRGEGRGVSD